MEVTIRAAELKAHEVIIGELIALEQVNLTGSGIVIPGEPGEPIRVAEATATVILTEASLNRFLARQDLGPARDVQIATLSGRVRITGRAMWGRFALPFVAMAVPEIEAGARLRLNFQQIHLVGALRFPGIGVTWIGEKINQQVAKAIDVSNLPIPLRLTGLTVEPGRLLLTATAKLELRALEQSTELQASK